MRETRVGTVAKAGTRAACTERMLRTQDMQPYCAVPVENCSCLICLPLGKAVRGPGTRGALGHPCASPRGRAGYLVLPGQWQV